jgi:two-component system sensor histidine kinase YesM
MGMTEEKAAEILAGESTSEAHGYGVRNINHRIRLCYGQQYGLTYHTSPGLGTLVEIRIPAINT